MKFKEAWKISKIVTFESLFKGTLQMSGGVTAVSAQQDPEKAIRRIRSSTRANKFLPTLVYGIYSAMIPLMTLSQGSDFNTLLATNTIFLALALVFLMSFNLLYMTTFVSGESLAPLAALPLTREDLSRISVLSFVRMFDIPLAVFLVTYPVVYLLMTASIIGTIIVFSLNLVNSLMALFLTFFLARGFNTRMLSLGGSRKKSALRVVLFAIYGIGTFGMLSVSGYLIPWIPQLIPFFTAIEGPQYGWLILIYPFSFGYLAALITSSSSPSAMLLSLLTPRSIIVVLASAFYIILGYIGYKRGTRALRQLALGEVGMAPKITPPSGEIKIDVKSVFSAIFRKDLKLASRNMAYVGFLLMPVIGVVVFASVSSTFGVLRVSIVLMATLYTSFFMTLFALMSLQFEGKGASVLAQLPVSVRKVVQAKSVVAAAFSITMPAALLLLSLFEPLTTFYSVIIAATGVGTVYAASLIGTTVACSVLGEGRLATPSFQGHMAAYIFLMIVSGIFIVAPTAVYVFVYYFLAKDSLLCVSAMALTMVTEIAVATLASKAALKR